MNKPIEESKVTTLRTKRIYCPECHNKGKIRELEKLLDVLTSMPPQYQYKCECGYRTASTESYPALELKE